MPRIRTVYVCLQTKDAKSKDGRGGVAIKQPYLRVVGLEQDIESEAHNSPTFTSVPLPSSALFSVHQGDAH